jgi:hypothetical protein
VVWLLVELTPNGQHYGMALPMLGAVLGCHGDPPQGSKVGLQISLLVGFTKV